MKWDGFLFILFFVFLPSTIGWVGTGCIVVEGGAFGAAATGNWIGVYWSNNDRWPESGQMFVHSQLRGSTSKDCPIPEFYSRLTVLTIAVHQLLPLVSMKRKYIYIQKSNWISTKDTKEQRGRNKNGRLLDILVGLG